MSLDWAGLVLGPNLRIFGEDPEKDGPVTWTSVSSGISQDVPAIFDEGYKPLAVIDDADGLLPTNITTGIPHLGVCLTDFPVAPLQGDRMVVRGKTYEIREVQPDSHGGADIFLNLVSLTA